MLRLLKVAMPFSGLAVNVPSRPLPPIRARVTGLAAAVTTFPLLSSTTTWTAGEIVAPAKALEGCCRNANFAGKGAAPPAGGLMVKLMLVVEARAGLLATSVYPLPAVLTVRLLKVAMPFWESRSLGSLQSRRRHKGERHRIRAVVAAFALLSSTAT